MPTMTRELGKLKKCFHNGKRSVGALKTKRNEREQICDALLNQLRFTRRSSSSTYALYIPKVNQALKSLNRSTKHIKRFMHLLTVLADEQTLWEKLRKAMKKLQASKFSNYLTEIKRCLAIEERLMTTEENELASFEQMTSRELYEIETQF